jgi:hypothetical protein
LSPFRMPFVLVLVVAALAAPAAASAATLHVAPAGSDANPCTSDRPCASFARAYSVATPGSVVLVAGGTYGTQRFSNLPAKGGDRVVFQPAPGASVTIGRLSVVGSHGIEVRDMRATEGWGVTEMGSNVVYRNIVVTDVGETGGYLGGSTDVQIIGGEIGRVDSDDGIHINNADGQNTNVLIDGLYMHDLTINRDPEAHADCLQAGSVVNLTIRNSRFINCATQGVFTNPYAGGEVRDVVIENNWFGPAQLGYDSLYVGDAVGVLVRNNSFTNRVTVYSRASNTSLIGNILVGSDDYTCSVLADNTAVFRYNVTTESCDDAQNHTIAPGAEKDYVNASPADPAAFDLHLKRGAKAIDRGDPSNFASTDFDGHARPAGGAPDAGAHEFGAGPPRSAPPPAGAPKPGAKAKRLMSRVRLTRKRVCRRPAKSCRTRVVVTLRRSARLTVRVKRVGSKRVALVRRARGKAGRNSIVLRGRKLRRGAYRITVKANRKTWPVRLRLRVGRRISVQSSATRSIAGGGASISPDNRRRSERRRTTTRPDRVTSR